MNTPPEIEQLQFSSDRYLELHDFSNEAYERVNAVLDKWSYMVTLATQRALSQLFYDQLPDNVIPLQRPPVSPDFVP